MGRQTYGDFSAESVDVSGPTTTLATSEQCLRPLGVKELISQSTKSGLANSGVTSKPISVGFTHREEKG